jgi:3-hydroxybutyryl-CoA dehydrogenase
MGVKDIKTVGVVGTGIMGHGISLVCARAGYQVNITTRRRETLKIAFSKIKSELEVLVRNHIITKEQSRVALARIKCTLDRGEAVRHADFVIETIKEDVDLKKQIFKELDEECPKHTILATNTSSLSITELASATRREDKVVGLHFWNPPYLMPLVEIIKGAKTSEDTIDIAKQFTRTLERVPVVCKDSPGFIGVRLQAALFIEAMSILEQGLASAEDIDTTARMSLGMRLPVVGPLETVDMGGLDTFLYAYDYLHRNMGDRFRPPNRLRQLVNEGRLGLKTGKGFYKYTTKSAEALMKRRDEWLMDRLKKVRKKVERKYVA